MLSSIGGPVLVPDSYVKPVRRSSGRWPAAPDPALADGVLVGKRDVDEASGLELLCARAGAGSITVDGRAVERSGANRCPRRTEPVAPPIANRDRARR